MRLSSNKLILIVVACFAGCKLIPEEGQLDCGADGECLGDLLCSDVDRKCYSSEELFPDPDNVIKTNPQDSDVGAADEKQFEEDTETETGFDSASAEASDSDSDTESNIQDSSGDDRVDNGDGIETDMQGFEASCQEGSASGCDDSDSCTVDDKCIEGVCVGGQTITECLSGDSCCPEGCLPEEDRDCLIDFGFRPSNIASLIKSNWQTYLDAAVSTVIKCGEQTLVFDSDLQTYWCDLDKPEAFPLVVDEEKNIRFSLVPLASLTVEEGSVLKIDGKYPVILLVFGKVEIKGGIDVGAHGNSSGPGGDVSKECGTGATGTSAFFIGGGGGGGGFGSAGAEGGSAMPSSSGGSGGSVNGEEEPYLVPLRGGCSGGKGTEPGGGAGGAIQISSSQGIHVYESGFIAAQGGGGAGAPVKKRVAVAVGVGGVVVGVGGVGGVGGEGLGGGGGSGGGVLLEAPNIVLDDGAWITANGGGGGAGSVNGEQTIQPGEDGHQKDGDRAMGGDGTPRGGEGGAAEGLPSKGENGVNMSFSDSAGGGGGGGGYGRIVVKGTESCTLEGEFSPPRGTEAVHISCK